MGVVQDGAVAARDGGGGEAFRAGCEGDADEGFGGGVEVGGQDDGA